MTAPTKPKREKVAGAGAPVEKPVRVALCECGHTGAGESSEHAEFWAAGHGRCTVKGCKCKQFTFKGWQK